MGSTILYYVLTCLLFAGAGCAGVSPRPEVEVDSPTVAGEYEYLDGILRRNYRAPIHEVWDAALQAIGDLRVSTETRRKDDQKGVIQGTTHEGSRLTIEIIRKSSGLTRVEVQIGWIGDRLKSQFVHDAIAGKLGGQRRHPRSSA